MISLRSFVAGGVVATLAALGAGRADALTALEGFSGGTAYTGYHSETLGDMVGWRFSIAAPITLTALGVWNDGDLIAPHMVGVWGEGTLLASQEVDATEGVLSGDFYFEAIGPVSLSAGTYTIAALYTSADGDSYISGAASVSFAPEIAWLASLYPSTVSAGFAEPTVVTSSFGRFGPNFQFDVAAVPLPGAAALLAGGMAAFGALGAARRRRG